MDKVTTITTLTTRKPRWQYPPAAPSPRILHLPRRPRRKPPQKANATKPSLQSDKRGKLESSFDQERGFARGANLPILIVRSGGGDDHKCEKEERRERVAEREGVVVEEEKWRFQAEMLRAECNLLRMEREITAKKMERRRAQVERILRSAVQTLRGKSISDGKGVSLIFDDVQQLVEKLEKLQRKSRAKDLGVRKGSHFDKQASLLRRRLEKSGGESDGICAREIQETAEASLSFQTTCSIAESFVSSRSCNMEVLRRKMDGLSNGSRIERMQEECCPTASPANSSVTSSASISMPLELPDLSSSSGNSRCKKSKPSDERACSGRCQAIVQRVLEQVRAETEQWSQMQEMLGKVGGEMEELEASRDFWENKAFDSDYQIQALNSAVQEWRRKALYSEDNGNELRAQVSLLHAEIEMLRKDRAAETARNKNSPSRSVDAPNEMEKRVLVCCSKENPRISNYSRKQKEPHACTSGLDTPNRSPFKDIGNSSSFVRQNSRAVFPLQCPLPNVQEKF